MSSTTAEFAFDTREWRLVILAIGSVCGIAVLIGCLAARHPWRYTLSCAIGLPVFSTLLLWLIALPWYHRSYVVGPDGITLRHRGRDIQHLPWVEIADIQSRPLRIITRTGRKIQLHLLRSEYDRAREFLPAAFNDYDRNA